MDLYKLMRWMYTFRSPPVYNTNPLIIKPKKNIQNHKPVINIKQPTRGRGNN